MANTFFASWRLGVSSLGVLAALSATVATQAPLEFDVASIKRNPGLVASGGMRRLPDGTFIATNTTVRGVIGSAYPSEDNQYENLPDWAIRERYDITVKPPAGATAAQTRQMWQALFRDRLKLEAHEETRDTPTYALVVTRADGKLGPMLKPSPHDCGTAATAPATPQPPRTSPPTEDEIMAGCGALFGQGRIVTGGILLSSFVRSISGLAGRLVEDRTGLQGYFAFTLTYAEPNTRPGGDGAGDPGDATSIFTALQEQLGLKLEASRKQLRTVVIDHIERPTEN